MCVIGFDYYSIDPIPFNNYNNSAHIKMLYEKGCYIIENLNFEELSKDNIKEFFIVCSAPKFTGCTGSWIRPVAII